MEKKLAHKFVIGKTDGGKWLAISATSPYFCLEGESAREVEDQAGRALEFYFGTAGKSRPLKGQKSLSTFSKTKTVEKEIA